MNGRKVKYLFPVLLLILALLTQYKSEAALQYAQNVNSLIDFNGLSINTSTLTAYDSKTPVNNGYFFKNTGAGVDFSPVSGVFGKDKDDVSLEIKRKDQSTAVSEMYSNGKQNSYGVPESGNLYSINWNWAFGDFEANRRVDMKFYNGSDFSYKNVNSFSYDEYGENISDVLTLFADGRIRFFGKLSDKKIFFDLERWYNFEIRILMGEDGIRKSVAYLYIDGLLIMSKEINNSPDELTEIRNPYSVYTFAFVSEACVNSNGNVCPETTYADDISIGKYKSHSLEYTFKSFGDLSLSSEFLRTDGLHIATNGEITLGQLKESLVVGKNISKVSVLDENYMELDNDSAIVKSGWYIRIWADKLKKIDAYGTEGYNFFDRKIVPDLNRLKISDICADYDRSKSGEVGINLSFKVRRSDSSKGIILVVANKDGNALSDVDISRVDAVSENGVFSLSATIDYENLDRAYVYLLTSDLMPLMQSAIKIPTDEAKTLKNGSLAIECEDIAIQNTGSSVVLDSGASGGGAVYFPGLKWNLEDVTSDELYSEIYLADSEEDGVYKLWYRAKSTTEKTSSFWWDLNNGTYSKYFFSSVVDGAYRWSSIDIELEKGKSNYIALRHRSSGYIDKIIITNDALFVPVGVDDMPVFRTEEELETYYLSLYPEPEIKPIASHPRLYFTSESLPEFKVNLASDSFMKSRLPTYRRYASEDINCKLNTALSNNHNEYLLVRLMSRALMWLIGEKNDKAFADETIAHLKDYLETVRTPDDASDITRQRGNILLTASVVYDWMYDAISEADRQILIDYMMKIIRSKEIGWPPTAMSSISSHAGEYEIFRDLLAAGIAVYDEYPTLYEVAAGRMFAEMVPARNRLRPTGRFDVGHDYGETRFYSEVWADATIQAMGYDSIFEAGSTPVRWLIRSQMPYGFRIPNGDMYSLTQTDFDRYYSSYPLALGIAANLYGDSFVKREYERIRTVNGLHDVFNEFFALVFCNPEVESEIHDEWSLSEYTSYPLSGIMARTSWQEGKNSDCALAFMNMHEGYFGDHQNLYTGDFQVYYKGLLAMNTGTYNASDEHNIAYKRKAIAGNVMLCYDPDETFAPTWSNVYVPNDGGQRTPYLDENGVSKGAYTKNLGEYDFDENGVIQNRDLVVSEDVKHYIGPNTQTPEFSYIGGNLTNAYSDKVSDYHRSMVFMDLFDDDYPAALIVFDKMTSKNASLKKTWLLHSEEKPVIVGNQTIITRTNNGFDGKLVNSTLLPLSENLSTTVVGGNNNEMYTLEGKTYAPKENAIEAGKYRIEISPKSQNTTDVFLNAMYVTSASGNLPELKMHYEYGEGYVGVTVKDRTVTFSETAELIRDSFTLNIRDNGFDEVSVLLTDMEDGVWSVSDGKTSFNVRSEIGKNALYFRCSPGSYTVSKACDDAMCAAVDYPEAPKRKIGDFSVWKYREADESIKNGNFVYLSYPAILEDGTAYMSVEALKEFGASVSISGNNVSIASSLGETRLTVASKSATSNGASLTLAKAPFARNGTIYVSSVDAGKALGYTFTYNSSSLVLTARKNQ